MVFVEQTGITVRGYVLL